MILHIFIRGDVTSNQSVCLSVPASTVLASQHSRLDVWLRFSLIRHSLCLSPSLLPADEGPSWSCDFVGAYHGLVPECCSFSADGSLLAVSFQEVVTVWSPASWELLTTLSQPPKAIRSERLHTHSLGLITDCVESGCWLRSFYHVACCLLI